MGCLLFAFLSHTFLVLHKPLPDAVHSLNKRIRWNFLYIGSRFASLTGASEAGNASAASTSQKNYSRCCTALPALPYLRCVNSVSYSSYVPLSLESRCFLLITVYPTETKKPQKSRLRCVLISWHHKSTLCICGYSFDSFSIFRKIIGLISQRGSAAWFLPSGALLKPYILFISL